MFKSLRSTFGDPSRDDRRASAVKVLRDPQAPLEEAAAALLLLGGYSDPEAVELIRKFAANESYHPYLQQSAAEALADVLVREGFQESLLIGLSPKASTSLLAFLTGDESVLSEAVKERLSL